MNRNLLTFSIVLFVTTSIQGMDKFNKPDTELCEVQFFQHMPFPRIFDENIPSEISAKVFDLLCFASPTLCDGARCINHFSGVSKSMNILIKDNTIPLIKKLSDAYECSHEYAARVLQTKTASKIVLKQLGFAAMCASNNSYSCISPQDSLHIKKSKIDLNFTYGKKRATQLISVLDYATMHAVNPYIVEWLIANGADINVVDRNGSTAPFIALDTFYNSDKQFIEYFWDHPSFNINDIKWYGRKKTLLMQIISLLQSRNPNQSVHEGKRSIRLGLLHNLLARGADPELECKTKRPNIPTTPLALAEQFNDQEVIDIIKDAIAKKHAQAKKDLIS